jgi:hypothetical protein
MKVSLRGIHRLSGLLIGLFALAHLGNHLCALGGIDRHINVMDALRRVYRNPVCEALLLGAVICQIISGLTLLRKRTAPTDPLDKLQAYSGIYLAFFLAFHTGAVLIGRNVLHLDTNFYFAAAGLRSFPLFLFFIPYYFLAVVSLFSHIGCALRPRIGIEAGRRRVFASLLLGTATAVLLLMAFGGFFYDIRLPAEYVFSLK